MIHQQRNERLLEPGAERHEHVLQDEQHGFMGTRLDRSSIARKCCHVDHKRIIACTADRSMQQPHWLTHSGE